MKNRKNLTKFEVKSVSHLAVRFLLCCLVCIIMSNWNSPKTFAATDNELAKKPKIMSTHKESELLVKFKEKTSDTDKTKIHQKHASNVLRDFKSLRIHHVKLKKGITIEKAIQSYAKEPDVEYVEPNYVVSKALVPNDSNMQNLWGLDNNGQTGGVPDADIDAPEAWNITTGSGNVVVAVVDTGIDYNHEDLSGNVWINEAELNGLQGVDDDGNGYVDDIHGIDVFNHDGDPYDDNSHGTHVAGTIGATGNNGVGVAGVNWTVRIMACKFLSASGFGDVAGAIECLEYIKMMKERGVNIITTNNSWGGGGESQALREAIDAQRDILFIAAAGNSNLDNDENTFYPANYHLLNLVSVAATNYYDSKAYFSNFGKNSVHVGAPGEGILSTVPNNGYASYSGTSMATPHVTGLAALLKSQDPARDWRQLKNLLLTGGDSIPALADTTQTGRRINAYGSLTCADNSLFTIIEYPLAPAVGVPATLSARSIRCTEPVGPVTVTLSDSTVISLHDDGIAPDLVAGDGVFSGEWIPSGITVELLTFTSPVGGATVASPPVSISAQVTVDPPATLISTNASSCETGNPYRQVFTSVGGVAPYTWNLIYGALPDGLTLNPQSGEITGVPTVSGTFLFDIQVRDSLGMKASRWWTLIVESPSIPAIVTEDFETGDLSHLPWVASGDGVWSVNTTNHHGGLYSAEAPVALNDSQSAAVEVVKECVDGTVSFWYSVSSEANYDYLQFYIDGVLQGQWSGTVSWNQASYQVSAGNHAFRWVYAKDSSVSAGSDTVWIDDIAIPLPAIMPPPATIQDDFETGNLTRLPWSTVGDGVWSVVTANPHGGLYAAEASTAIIDNQSSTLEVTLDCPTGNISFWYSVSSEANFDYLHFYIDGVEQAKWSGSLPWSKAEFPVSAGPHTFRWVYTKDGSVSIGSDTAWIDDVIVQPAASNPPGEATEDFETGNLEKLPWGTDGDGVWTALTTRAHGGMYAAEAPAAINDVQSATLRVTLDCTAGDASFWYSVSSESNYDYLKFYIDDVLQGQWSGEVPWTRVSYGVTAGTHTFKWVYSKDGSVSAGLDTAWIDDIVIPLPVYAPIVTITSPVSGITNNSRPVLTYTVSGGSVVVRVDGVVVNKVSGDMLDPLADGTHTVRVEATDAANNTGFAEVAFTVDTVPPAVAIDPVTTPTKINSQTVTGTRESNATISVATSTTAVAGVVTYPTATTWSCAINGLTEGANNIIVTATDAATNGQTVMTSIILDTVAPTVGITSPAAGLTINRPLLIYTVSDGNVVVKVDGIIVNKVSGDTLDELAEGSHTVRVESTDAAANTGFAEVTFTVTATAGFNDNLENGTQKWGASTGLWHVITSPGTYADSFSGTSSWWYGRDDTGTFNTGTTNSGGIISVPFIVPANGELSFWSWEQTESSAGSYDTRKVYISTNNGATWTQIFQSLDNTATWHKVNVDLTAYAGMAAKLKFEFNTVDGVLNGFRGWYVDDIYVATPKLLDEDFETGNLSRLPWVTGGNGPWTVTTATKHGGSYAAEAPVSIENSQSATMEVTMDCAASNISFWYSVSSEINWDFLIFYVDGVEKGRWSGSVPWTQASFGVTAGTHTFKWVYAKDSSVSVASDTAWVDDIVFPVPIPAQTANIASPVAGVTNNNAPLLAYTASGGTVVVKADGNVVNKVSGDVLDVLADGTHAVRVEVSDASGIGFAEVTFTVDTIPPTVGIDPVTTPTNAASQIITGTREANAMISVTANTTAIVGVVTYPSATTWSCTVSAIAEGANAITATAYDAATNNATASTSITLDTAAPTVNIISPAAVITNNNRPILTYTVSDGTIVVKVDGAVVNKVTGNALDILADGTHTVRVEATDAAGNAGFAEEIFAVDTVAPVVAISSPTAGLTNNIDPVLTYTASDGAVVVKLDGTVVAKQSGETLGPLADGQHTVRVEATDAAGNASFAEKTFVVDTLPPGLTIDQFTTPTKQSSQTVIGTREAGALVTVTVNTTATVDVVNYPSATTWSCTVTALAEGANTVTATAYDGAANVTMAATAITLDTVAPTVSITAPAAGLFNSRTPVLTYFSTEGTPIVTVDGIVITKASGDTLGPLADGPHTVRVEATDGAGNSAFAEVSFTVDATAPTVTINSPTAGISNNRTPLLSFTLSEGAAVVTVDGAVVPLISGDTLDPLAEGPHTVRVDAVDAAGNSVFAEVSFSVDATAPTVTIASPTAGLANNSKPLLNYTASDGTVIVKVDGVVVNKVSGDSLDTLGDGLHVVRVEATDAVNNSGFAEVSFTIDTVPPAVSITSPVAGITNNSTPVLNYTVSDGTAVVRVNGVVVTKLSGDLLDALADGTHTVRVEATDAATNTSFAEVSFTVDTIPPNVGIDPVVTPTTSNGQTITGTRESNATISVSLNTAATVGLVTYPTATTWSCPVSGLVEGDNAVTVSASDAATNSATASATITLDTVAPVVTITAPTAGLTNTRTPLLTFSVTEGTPVVTVDGVTLTKVSGDTLGPLADGLHTVKVEASDAAGNLGLAEVGFTIDATAPTVTIMSPTAGLSNNRTPVLLFTVSDGDAVVKVDGAVVPMLSGDTLRPLADGPHTVRVEAIDAAGNAAFAEVSFTVDATAPTVTIASPNAGNTNNNTPVLDYAASDGTIIVKVDGVVANKFSGDSLDTLADGVHVVRVEAKDTADNFGFAEVSFTIDTAAPTVAISTPLSGTTPDNTPLLSYTVNDGTVVVKVDGMAVNKIAGDSLDGLSNGAHTVRVESTDSAGNTGLASVTFTVDYAPLSVATASLHWGTTDVAYNQSLAAIGGVPPYAWTVISGVLPNGLSLNSANGAVSGTPTAPGSFTLTVRVEDADGASASRLLTINVYEPLAVGTTSLARGYVGAAYSQTLAATGGLAPYTWTISSGAIPAGLSLNSATGVLSGTPTATGTSDFTIQVQDTNGTTASKSLSITIDPSRADLVLTAISGPASGTGGSKISVSATVKNQGQVTASNSTLTIYLSIDGTITPSDIKLADKNINNLAAGSSQSVNLNVTIPTSTTTGTYYIGAIGDRTAVVPETNEENNGKAGNTININ